MKISRLIFAGMALLVLGVSGLTYGQTHGIAPQKGVINAPLHIGGVVKIVFSINNNEGFQDTMHIYALRDVLSSVLQGDLDSGDILRDLTWSFTAGAGWNNETTKDYIILPYGETAYIEAANAYTFPDPADPNGGLYHVTVADALQGSLLDTVIIEYLDQCTSGAGDCPTGMQDNDAEAEPGVLTPAPNVCIEKYVSVDGGATWLEADSAPGPSALVGSDLLFKVEVTNCGNVPLTGIVVTDTVFGGPWPGVATDLAPGASDESDVLTENCDQPRQHENTATVFASTGIPDPPGPAEVTASDPAFAVCEGEPCIDIEKWVSVDGGATWHEADSAPGPSATVGQPVLLRVQVCNCGEVPLTDIVVTDTVHTFTGVATSLGVEECDYSDPCEVPCDPAGEHYDLATAVASQAGPVDDPAYYTCRPPGNEGCTPGYWKNSPGCWECAVPYGPDATTFEDVFGVVISVGSGKKAAEDPTLMEALNGNGGGVTALARHAVAAFLNACDGDIDYPMTVDEVIAAVQGALPDGDIEGVKNMLAMNNELGCGQSSDNAANPCHPENDDEPVPAPV